MAFSFNKQSFIADMLQKAKEQGIYKEVEYEIEAFDKKGQLDYFPFIADFVKAMEERGLLPLMLRRSGGGSYLTYLLGISKINPKGFGLSNIYFVSDPSLRFEICLPNSQIVEAAALLGSITCIQKSEHGVFTFGEKGYQVALLGHDALERLAQLEKETGIMVKDIPLNDQDVIDFMFAPYDEGYAMPNLFACYMGYMEKIYGCKELFASKSLACLAKLLTLFYGVHREGGEAVSSLQHLGVDVMVVGKDQLCDLLAESYEFSEADAWTIAQDVAAGRELPEWETMLLKSKEVPQYILDQFDNIRYLHYYAYGVQSSRLSYLFAYYKYHCRDIFLKNLPRIPFKSSVGPFFFIGGNLKAHLEPIASFDPNRHFFDSDMSHFEFFQTLGVEGDYGNYPRGRVIFDHFRMRMVIYIDRSLNKREYKEKLKRAYCLGEPMTTVFRFDGHYRHDQL